jgi:fatty-acyl-CoA synthase
MTEILRARRNTIGDALHRAARRHGAATALTFGDRSWSFEDLDRAASRLASRLRALGLRHGDRVAAFGYNSDAYVIAWLACCRAGFVHVPISYQLTGSELEYIVTQSGARAVLHDLALAETLRSIPSFSSLEFVGSLHGGDGLDVLKLARDAALPADADFDVAEGDLVQLLYTSGTTAAPKGAMMTHGALLSEYFSCIYELDFKGSDRVLSALPLYHTAQMHVFLMPQLLVGAQNTLIDAPVAERVLGLVESERITSFFAPPTVWINLLRHPDFDSRDLGSLRKAYYGASIMPVPVLEEMRRRMPQTELYNCYGQSEIAPLATVLRPEEHAERPASAGRPVLNVATRVVDPEMRDVAVGEHGEIVHRSPQLCIGYWEKPDETAAAFEGGWFHSGDVGYLDAEGYLYIVDRIKDVINTGGVVVASREVEEALYTHPSVYEVAVIGLPDPKWIEAVCAVVVLREGAVCDERTLIDHVRGHLAPYKVPKRVFFADTLPRNTAGKLLKRVLRSRYAESVAETAGT